MNKGTGIEGARKITVSRFLRRRLMVVLKTRKYVETLKESESLIRGGHIIVGNKMVKDPEMLISRNLEDYISWKEDSKIRQKIDRFKNNIDDYNYNN